MKPKKNEKRATFLNRGGNAHDWRMHNAFTFDVNPPDIMTALCNEGDSIKVLIAGDILDIEAASSFVDLLASNPDEDFEIQINSAGGSVDQGMMMFNAMKEHIGHITTTNVGQAASTALSFLMGGDKIRAHENTSLMMHPAQAIGLISFNGDPDDESDIGMAAFAKEMAVKGTSQIIDLLSIRSGQSRAKVEKMVFANGGAGTTLTASEAKELGFVDEMIPNKPRQKNASPVSVSLAAWREQQLAERKRVTLAYPLG